MRSYLIGYGVLIGGYLATLAFGGLYELWMLAAVSSLFVLIAKSIGEITLTGTVIVLLILNLFMPLAILWVMGIHAEMGSVFSSAVKEFDWLRTIVPVLAGVLTYLIISPLKKGRGNRK